MTPGLIFYVHTLGWGKEMLIRIKDQEKILVFFQPPGSSRMAVAAVKNY